MPFRIHLRPLFVVALLFAGPLAAQSPDADAVTGLWKTIDDESGDPKSHIWIYRAKNGKYYGKIHKLYEPLNDNGNPKRDKNNPDEAKQSRPVKGLVIMEGFEWEADDEEWDNGEIYDPESGKTYDCYLQLVRADKLKVRGYIGVSLIGRTQYWYRVEE